MKLLSIKGLSSGYGESMILRDLDLSINQGDIVVLMGSNGVGKTTLLKSMMNLIKPKAGTLEFEGKDLTKSDTDNRALAGMGYVPQGRDIFPFLTVTENLLLGVEARGALDPKYLEEVYGLFPVLKELGNRKGGALSGGQQQQLAIARIILTKPKLMILDEPTEGIQPSIVKDIGRAIKYLNKDRGISILLVEQFVDFALELADYYYLMEHGEITKSGEVNDETRDGIRSSVRI